MASPYIILLGERPEGKQKPPFRGGFFDGEKRMQSLSAMGAAFIRAQEGFAGHTYKDSAGILTLGEGFTWLSAAFRAWWAANKPGMAFGPGATMTKTEADDCLVAICDAEYGRAVADFLGHDVPQHVFDGMVSPVYNLGEGSLSWRWATWARKGDYEQAADYLRHTGTTAGGETLKGLVRRRAAEADLIEHGDYGTIKPVPKQKTVEVLRKGERGPEVAQLIRDLARLGVYHGSLDDLFGHGTLAAVLAFQRAHGLKADGIAGPVTLKAISDALAA